MDQVMEQNDERRRCRGMLHIVKQGDTLYKIAKQYGVPLSRVMYANPYVDVYNLQVGDEICVPVMGVRPPMPGMPGMPGHGPGNMRPPMAGGCPCMRPPLSGGCPCMRPPLSGGCPGMRPPLSGNCPRMRTSMQENGMMPEGQMDEAMPGMPGGQMDETMPTVPGSQMDETMPSMPGGQMDEAMPSMPEGQMDEAMPGMPRGQMDEAMPMMSGGRMDETIPGGQFEEADVQEDIIPPLQQGCRNGMGDPMREGCTEQVYSAMPGEQNKQRSAMPGEQTGNDAVMPWKRSMENEERMLEEYLMGMPRRS